MKKWKRKPHADIIYKVTSCFIIFPFSQILFNNLILPNKLKYNLSTYIMYIYGET